MKKYIIKNADGSEQSEMQAIHKSRKEAGETLMDYICDHNEDLDVDDDDYLSPFDFALEEVECMEVNEVITDFESARKALGGKPNADFTVVKKILSRNVVQLEDVARLVTDINPKHIEALIALNKLLPSHRHGTRKMDLYPISRIGIKTSDFRGSSMTRMLRGSWSRLRITRRRLRMRGSVLGFASNRPRAPRNSASNSPTFTTRFSCNVFHYKTK
mgnify:CR=1 FL=1|jgi:hypothetical protein